ncbi:MAG: EAL domain-containing protein [Marinobacter sp.]|uniref:EAL domain-containing protein n=1 Tax=Marinobacter sp. TaxID=50741 RepID=UPI0034A016CE
MGHDTPAQGALDQSTLDQDHENRRQAAVDRYDILDTPPDGAFDRITAIASRLFDVPIAIVSIVDHDRIWFKSHHGLDAQQIGRDPGLCASAILHDEPWVVTDAKCDPRALNNPLVAGEFGLQFYAGAPLTTHDGFNLGTLCVIDQQPRVASDAELATLQDLAAIVMDELELRRAAIRAVGDLQLAVEEIDQQKELAQVTLESIGDAVITTDAAALVTYLNPVAEKLTGWKLSEARDKPIQRVFHILNENTRLPAANPVERALREGTIVGLANHTVLLSLDGKEYAIEDSAAPIRRRDGEIVGGVMVFHDVSEARQLANEISWQASHDALTGLINRNELENSLTQMLKANRPDACQHALLFFDLDRFKIVNDSCGHHAGDELLIQLARIFCQSVRESDQVARIGGDEFAILMKDCTLGEAQAVAEKMRDAVDGYRFLWEDHAFQVSVSIGVVSIECGSKDVSQLLKAADMACYVAKEGGRNKVHVYDESDELLAGRHGEMRWVNRLNNAFAGQHLKLYGQRIVALNPTGQDDEHIEVLVRLEGEDDRIIAPEAFLPAAERHNLMPKLDCYVVEHLFLLLAEYRAAAQTHDATAPSAFPRFTINLSGASLGNEDLLQLIRRKLDSGLIAPGHLGFEITETAAIANLGKAVDFIEELRDLGCQFALDDFGTGLSSFAYLKNLPVNFIKIDGHFIRHIVANPLDRAMVEAINTLAHRVGMKTIAKSVESDAIVKELRQIGVDYVQGHILHRPCSLDLDFLKANTTENRKVIRDKLLDHSFL